MNTVEQFMQICDQRLKELGITRADLLRRIGQSQSLFIMALKRKTYMGVEALVSISEELKIPISVLLGLEKRKIPSDIQLMEDMLLKIPERDRQVILLNIKNFYNINLKEDEGE